MSGVSISSTTSRTPCFHTASMRWRASVLFSSSDVTGASSSLPTHVSWLGNNVSLRPLAYHLSTQHGLTSNHSAAIPSLRSGRIHLLLCLRLQVQKTCLGGIPTSL